MNFIYLLLLLFLFNLTSCTYPKDDSVILKNIQDEYDVSINKLNFDWVNNSKFDIGISDYFLIEKKEDNKWIGVSENTKAIKQSREAIRVKSKTNMEYSYPVDNYMFEKNTDYRFSTNYNSLNSTVSETENEHMIYFYFKTLQ